MGIKYITVYAFSTENWKRPKDEVDFLMNLLYNYLKDAEKTLAGENVVIRAIGSRAELSEKITGLSPLHTITPKPPDRLIR